MTPPRVLVTGASGFIGRAVLPLLASRGCEVYAVSRRPPRAAAGAVHRAVDLLADGAPHRVIAEIRPTHLLHLAWYAEPGRFWTAPINLAWVAATLQLHLAFAEHGGRRSVCAGTCAEYDWRYDRMSETATPVSPATLYGKAKNSTRVLLDDVMRQFGITMAWGRLFFMYGPREARGRLVSDVINDMLAGRPALCTHGLQERDFMHVADVARAFVAILDSDHSGPVNIASGDCVAIREVVNVIAEQLGRPDLVRFGAKTAALDDPPRLAADVAILRQKIGFSPQFDLASGLAATIGWWRHEALEETHRLD